MNDRTQAREDATATERAALARTYLQLIQPEVAGSLCDAVSEVSPVLGRMFRLMDWGPILESAVPTLVELMTLDELQGAIDFRRSPLCEKLLSIQPALRDVISGAFKRTVAGPG